MDKRTHEADAGSPALVRPSPVPGMWHRQHQMGTSSCCLHPAALGCDRQPWRCSHSPRDTVTSPGCSRCHQTLERCHRALWGWQG